MGLLFLSRLTAKSYLALQNRVPDGELVSRPRAQAGPLIECSSAQKPCILRAVPGAEAKAEDHPQAPRATGWPNASWRLSNSHLRLYLAESRDPLTWAPGAGGSCTPYTGNVPRFASATHTSRRLPFAVGENRNVERQETRRKQYPFKAKKGNARTTCGWLGPKARKSLGLGGIADNGLRPQHACSQDSLVAKGMMLQC